MPVLLGGRQLALLKIQILNFDFVTHKRKSTLVSHFLVDTREIDAQS